MRQLPVNERYNSDLKINRALHHLKCDISTHFPDIYQKHTDLIIMQLVSLYLPINLFLLSVTVITWVKSWRSWCIDLAIHQGSNGNPTYLWHKAIAWIRRCPVATSALVIADRCFGWFVFSVVQMHKLISPKMLSVCTLKSFDKIIP